MNGCTAANYDHRNYQAHVLRRRRRRRRAPLVGPLFGTKETSSEKALKSHNSQQAHKTGSSR
jgi:hypothetical protein